MREYKLYVAAGIFLVLTAIKLLIPGAVDGMRAVIAHQIDKNIDYEQVIVTLGRKVEDYSAYFEREWAVFKSGNSPAPIAPESAVPSPESSSQPAPAPTPIAGPTPTPAAGPELSEELSAAAAEGLPFAYVYPLAAVQVSSGFGQRLHPIEGVEKLHSGLDLDAAEGEEIYAFADGQVVTAGFSDSYGNYIIIDHDSVYSTLYAHCSCLLVQTGDAVRAGEKIALAGHTGSATGPHLHFELRENGVCIDPEEYLC